MLDEQVRDVNRRTARLLKDLQRNITTDTDVPKLRDIDLLLSMPGLGQVIATTMLSEASRPLRERDYEALRCYAGTALVTKQSAKRKTVSMGRACNFTVRQAVFHWSGLSLMFDSRCRQHYDALRSSGHSHPRALRLWVIDDWPS